MKRCQNESQLQIAVARFLEIALPDECRAFHVPNGGRRDGRTGARLKLEGVKAGVADIVIVSRGFCAMIELKTTQGRLSPAQREWQAWAGNYDLPYVVCRSLQEVCDALRGWGINLKIAGLA